MKHAATFIVSPPGRRQAQYARYMRESAASAACAAGSSTRMHSSQLRPSRYSVPAWKIAWVSGS